MSAPQRIQLRRTKGWRKPDNTVTVARPSKWGNPWRVQSCIDNGFADTLLDAQRRCVVEFRRDILAALSGDRTLFIPLDILLMARELHELRGKNLACWCPLDQPCHADVLLELANR